MAKDNIEIFETYKTIPSKGFDPLPLLIVEFQTPFGVSEKLWQAMLAGAREYRDNLKIEIEELENSEV